MGHLGVVLYEYLGEEYPEVLGSILGALKSIVNVIGMTKMTPPIKDLLPRLTPILKNRSVVLSFVCIGKGRDERVLLRIAVTEVRMVSGGMPIDLMVPGTMSVDLSAGAFVSTPFFLSQ